MALVTREITRPSDYRVLFANTFGLKIFANGDVVLQFAIDEDPASPGETLHEQVGVALNLRSMKLLGKLLTDAIKGHEEATGQEVVISPEKLEQLADAVKIRKVEEKE